MIDQKWEGMSLDKDIIVLGNKVYGPDTCVFVPCQVNNFLTDHGAARGAWPIGVSWGEEACKFKARCRNPITGKQEHLGYFTDPAEAHEAWRARKHQHALRYAEQQTDSRIAAALRTRYATPAGESK